jgi:hypothetical protein
MVHVLTVEAGTYRALLDDWAPELGRELRVRRYWRTGWGGGLPAGVWIFSDLERLSPPALWHARRLHRRIRRLPGAVVLNDPAACLGRFELLRRLHARGWNDFQVCRLDEWERGAVPLRYPVFLRRDRDHNGPRTPLLHSEEELRRALARLPLKQRWWRRWQMMIAEFCDCRDPDGLTRKYSVMRIGPAFLPRHLLVSQRWVIKYPDVVNEDLVAEEQAYVEHCPHLEQVKAVFDLAGVEYGRMDYSVRAGRLQVWEINTNPTVLPPRTIVHPLRIPLQKQGARDIARALRALGGN